MRVEDWYFVEMEAKLVYSIKDKAGFVISDKILSCHHLYKSYQIEKKIKQKFRKDL